MYDERDEARGRRIAAARRARPATQVAMAAAAGVGLNTLKRAEAGAPLSAETAAALQAVLGEVLREPAEGGAAGPVVARSRAWRPRATTAMGCLALAAWLGLSARIGATRPELGLGLAWAVVLGRAGAWAAHAAAARVGRGGRRSWQVAGVALLVVGGSAAVLAPLARYVDNVRRTEAATEAALSGFAAATRVVAAADALVPGGDPLARHALALWSARLGGRWSPELASPGRLSAALRRRRDCAEEWARAPTYDAEACGPSGRPLGPDVVDVLVKGVVGGAYGDVGAPPAARELLEGPRYAAARAAAGVGPRGG